MFTFQALQLLLFLIPGFLTLLVLNSLISRKPHRSDLAQTAEALVYSMVVYALYSLIRKQSAVSIDQTSQSVSFSFDPLSFFLLIGLSIGLTIVFSFFVNKNVITKVLNKIGISPRSARLSVWHDAFYDYKRYIVIHFEDGRRLYGWPQYYSDGTDEPYLFVYKPYWIVESDEKSQLKETGLDGMLITPNQKIHYIGFMPVDFETTIHEANSNESK
ncbi:MAG: hypothetical protein IPM53_17915 [Anaerolineaceae bacterium]|nr:hypothetical protein [Anaerolineaceae bacterium]